MVDNLLFHDLLLLVLLWLGGPQRVVHQVAQVLAPDCVPLFLTDGFKEYLRAVLTHYGHWVQPPRGWATGWLSKPRWLPLPQLQYAQVVNRSAGAGSSQ